MRNREAQNAKDAQNQENEVNYRLSAIRAKVMPMNLLVAAKDEEANFTLCFTKKNLLGNTDQRIAAEDRNAKADFYFRAIGAKEYRKMKIS